MWLLVDGLSGEPKVYSIRLEAQLWLDVERSGGQSISDTSRGLREADVNWLTSFHPSSVSLLGGKGKLNLFACVTEFNTQFVNTVSLQGWPFVAYRVAV